MVAASGRTLQVSVSHWLVRCHPQIECRFQPAQSREQRHTEGTECHHCMTLLRQFDIYRWTKIYMSGETWTDIWRHHWSRVASREKTCFGFSLIREGIDQLVRICALTKTIDGSSMKSQGPVKASCVLRGLIKQRGFGGWSEPFLAAH